MSDDKRREAIAQTAQAVRESAASRGHHMSQTEAQARVANAVEKGDRKRENNNR